jgi:hypothetical protein
LGGNALGWAAARQWLDGGIACNLRLAGNSAAVSSVSRATRRRSTHRRADDDVGSARVWLVAPAATSRAGALEDGVELAAWTDIHMRFFRDDSEWRLRWDLWSIQLLLRLALAGGRGEARPEVHLYLADRYARLAEHHRRAGHHDSARRLQMKSEAHWSDGGGDGPPFAAAMAMPRPRPSVLVDAVSRQRSDGPDDAA